MGRHRRFAVSAASLVAAASMVFPSLAGATTASTKAPKPDFAYFAGKTITLVEPQVPAAITVATGSDVALFLDNYLHATVNLQYVSGNGIIAGTNLAAAAPPNGLTIGFTSVANALVSLATGPDAFTFNFKKLEWLGAIGASPTVIVSCNPAITSWSQVVHSTKPIVILASPASSPLMSGELLSKEFNFPATPLTGYTSTTAAVTGCERGDGDLAVPAFSTVLNAAGTGITPGVHPLFTIGRVPKISSDYPVFASIPTLASYVKKHPLKTKVEQEAAAAEAAIVSQASPVLPYFVPPNTPMPYVLALRAALTAAYQNPTIKKAIADVPDPNVLISASAVTTWVNASLKTYGPFIQKVYNSF